MPFSEHVYDCILSCNIQLDHIFVLSMLQVIPKKNIHIKFCILPMLLSFVKQSRVGHIECALYFFLFNIILVHTKRDIKDIKFRS